jgi:hypothetical protein
MTLLLASVAGGCWWNIRIMNIMLLSVTRHAWIGLRMAIGARARADEFLAGPSLTSSADSSASYLVAVATASARAAMVSGRVVRCRRVGRGRVAPSASFSGCASSQAARLDPIDALVQ